MISMFSSISARPNCLMPSPATRRARVVDPEDGVFVAVERRWLAVGLQIRAHRAEVIERRLRRDEPKLYELTGRVVH
jgi:hypothetical protein